jgi:hypothetical protein
MRGSTSTQNRVLAQYCLGVDVTLCNDSVYSVGNSLCVVPRLRAKAERQGRCSLQYHSPSRCILEPICTPTPTLFLVALLKWVVNAGLVRV